MAVCKSVLIDQLMISLISVKGDDEDSNKLVESFSDAAVSQLIVKANCVALLLPVKR